MSNFLPPLYSYVVLDTVQAAAADLGIANQQISFGNPKVPIAKWPTLIAGQCYIQASVAETPQVTTLTPTAANSSTYTFFIQQYNINTGETITRYYTYTTAASGDNATSICNAFRSQINADPIIQITATGAATLILTADTGYPIFTVTITATGGGLVQAATTPGVRSKNLQADLARQGITVSGAAYTRWHIEFSNFQGTSNTIAQSQPKVWEAFINEADADSGALVTRITELMQTFASGGTVVDPEILAVV
jgi:hypothetical protein